MRYARVDVHCAVEYLDRTTLAVFLKHTALQILLNYWCVQLLLNVRSLLLVNVCRRNEMRCVSLTLGKCLTVSMSAVPYLLAFGGETDITKPAPFDMYDIGLDCLFMIDVGINFCTAYTHQVCARS